jgi:outer membrane receptor protein involved in Fe transport
VIACLVISIVGSGLLQADPIQADPTPAYRGRPLVEVLQELEEQGLLLIFSSAVVKPDLRVTVEPSSTEPRAILEEILGALGLEARDGPAGSIVIVAGSRVLGTLRGRVQSVARGLPIAGAVVRIPDVAGPAVTGPDGSFELGELPAGSYDLLVEALGFRGTTLADVRVSPSDDATVIVWLLDQPGFVTEVIVTPSQISVVEQELAARRTVSNQDAVLVPSFGGDISRVVAYLPGVTARDNSAALHIRGSVAGDVSFVLDGLELYDPFHLQDFQSPFTLIDSNIVDRVGGFTADFGDRHGGKLEILTLLPEHPHRGEIEIGTLNSRISYRAPLSDGSGSWLVSARGWYPEALQDTIEIGGGERVDPRFGDLYAKGAFTLSPRFVVSVHGLGVYDHLRFDEPADEDGPGESANALTRNGYFWLSLLNSWTPAVNSETVLSVGSIDRRRDGLSEPQDDRFVVDDDRHVNFIGLRHDSSWKLGERNLLKAGLDVRELRATYRYFSALEDDPSAATSFRQDPDGTSFGVYIAHRIRIARSLTTELGVRWDRQDYTDDRQLSPRFNAVWQPGERTELRLGAGRYYQSQRIHELRVEDGETRFHRAEESYQAEMSFQHRFRAGLRLRLDAYYRRLTRLNPRYENLFQPVEWFPETGSDRVRIAPSRARLQGVELLLHGDVERPLTWWASYALSSAEDVIGSEEIPRSWDQTHTGKVLIGYRWGDRWMISLTGTTHTGWPTTPWPEGEPAPPGGEVEYTPELLEEFLKVRNTDRFERYIRLDAKGRCSFPVPNGRISLTVEVINLTDRENPCCVDEWEFEPRPGGSVDVERVFEHWRGITPSFSLLWEF